MTKNMLTRRQALAATAAVAASAGIGAATPASAYYQPSMQAALAALHAARNYLQHSLPDKGGHRLAAIHRVDQAIHQVQLGIQWANTH